MSTLARTLRNLWKVGPRVRQEEQQRLHKLELLQASHADLLLYSHTPTRCRFVASSSLVLGPSRIIPPSIHDVAARTYQGLTQYNLQYIGDTKPQTPENFVAKDKYGNSFYECNGEELPLRTRWVDYHDKQFDAYVTSDRTTPRGKTAGTERGGRRADGDVAHN